MIEFEGYLTGTAEKAFVRKTRKTALFALGFGVLLTLPLIFLFGKAVFRDDAFIYAMLSAMFIGAIIVFIPKGKKEHQAMLPKRIYMDKSHIVCVADRYTDSRLISDVTKVVDHGDFYELHFPFGKSSDKFICQKSLLKKGTLRGFENLFGKIIKKTGGNSVAP